MKIHRADNQIHDYINASVRGFVSDYREHLPAPVELEVDAFRTLGNLLTVLRRTPYPLYLLIDEYDNFANEVMTEEEGDNRQLVHADGPFKRLFEWVKGALAGQGLERLFLSEVSPIVLSDLTSGLNKSRMFISIPSWSSFVVSPIRKYVNCSRSCTASRRQTKARSNGRSTKPMAWSATASPCSRISGSLPASTVSGADALES